MLGRLPGPERMWEHDRLLEYVLPYQDTDY
jgi:hypothetical protein